MKTEKQKTKQKYLTMDEESLLAELAFSEAMIRQDVDAEWSDKLLYELLLTIHEFDPSMETKINTLKLLTIKLIHEKYMALPYPKLIKVLKDFEGKGLGKAAAGKYSMRNQTIIKKKKAPATY